MLPSIKQFADAYRRAFPVPLPDPDGWGAVDGFQVDEDELASIDAELKRSFGHVGLPDLTYEPPLAYAPLPSLSPSPAMRWPDLSPSPCTAPPLDL